MIGAEKQFRRELGRTTETEVRGDLNLNFRHDLGDGSETKRDYVVRSFSEKELEREARARQSQRYVRLMFWVAVATFVAAIIGVIATVLQP
jgi:hypothetical protein